MTERLLIDGAVVEVLARLGQDGGAVVRLGGQEYHAGAVEVDGGSLRLQLDGETYRCHVLVQPEAVLIADAQGVHRFSRIEEGAEERTGSAAGELTSQMPGKVLALLAEPGARVTKGTPLLILEAMKMEHEVAAPADGVVRAYPLQPGDRVMPGDLLVEFEAAQSG
jgi:3-methylcrotonyl-CoA carboxylase alpha subunit